MNRVHVDNLRLEVSEGDELLLGRVAKRLSLPEASLRDMQIERRALDARDKRDVHWILRVSLELSQTEREKVLGRGLARIPEPRKKDAPDREIRDGVPHGERPLRHPPVVIGSGPGGLFAAWLLAREGYAPVVLERGPAVGPRVRAVNAFDRGGDHDPESNILFGEGGAGTFSDGKLTTRTRSPLVGLVHQLLVECKAPSEILVQSKPHVGTDRLRAVLIYLRRQLEALGATFRWESKVTDLLTDPEGAVRGVRLEGGEEVAADAVILAIGHSARDTYDMLHERGVALEFKPFQLGLRIEHPQELLDVAQHGGYAERLPAAEYQLNDKRRGVFSFCMCPGGTLMASVSEAGYLCSNGMSVRKRDSGWGNSGLVFTIPPELTPSGGEHPLAGIELQRQLERKAFELGGGDYSMPAQRVPDYLEGRLSKGTLSSSYPRGHVAADLRDVLPGPTAKAIATALRTFGRRIKGYDSDAGLLVGPETRGSAPVRMPRDAVSRESVSTPGLYPVGEGAGYAGGIMSAAIDGLRSAAALIRSRQQA